MGAQVTLSSIIDSEYDGTNVYGFVRTPTQGTYKFTFNYADDELLLATPADVDVDLDDVSLEVVQLADEVHRIALDAIEILSQARHEAISRMVGKTIELSEV